MSSNTSPGEDSMVTRTNLNLDAAPGEGRHGDVDQRAALVQNGQHVEALAQNGQHVDALVQNGQHDEALAQNDQHVEALVQNGQHIEAFPKWPSR
jgi:hypothetical protein